MHIKKDDNVVVLSGKDRGKKAKVLRVLSKGGKVVVDGVAMAKRRRKPRNQGEKGQVIEIPTAIDASNVVPFCAKCKKGVRVGHEGVGKDKKRVCVTCKTKL